MSRVPPRILVPSPVTVLGPVAAGVPVASAVGRDADRVGRDDGARSGRHRTVRS
jgi:hypothetical protein